MPGYDRVTTPSPPMPRLAESETRRPCTLVPRRACQESFRENRGDSAKTDDIVWGIRGTYGGGTSATEGDVCLGRLLGVRATQEGKGRTGWFACRRLCRPLKLCSNGGETIHKRPADDFDGSRTEQRHSCGNGMTRTTVELPSGSKRPRQRHPPSTPVSGRGGGGRGGRGRRGEGSGRGGAGGGREGGRGRGEGSRKGGRLAQEAKVWV